VIDYSWRHTFLEIIRRRIHMILRSFLAVACLVTLGACQSTQPLTGSDLVADAKTRITEVDVGTVAVEITGDLVIVDVREPAEYADGHIPGATNIPRGVLEFRIGGVEGLEGLSNDERLQKPIALYCRSGGRSALAADTLRSMGYTNVRSIQGGFKAWQAQDLPVEEPGD
jgi:rhodanese-related sulfurtransferase